MAEELNSRQAVVNTSAPVLNPIAAYLVTHEPLPEDNELEIDNTDSTYGEGLGSDTTSITSSIAKGYVEYGRRYQVTKNDTPGIPSDEKQFESMNMSHLTFLILECQQDNPLFRSPIKQDAQHILDLGTGDGQWAIDVADRFPDKTVYGVDIFPPPASWVPPNCILEVDDFTKPWTWKHNFDLVHMRNLSGTMSLENTEKLYCRVYSNLAPGGWFEHIEHEVEIRCDDGTLPEDSILRGVGTALGRAAGRAGTSIGQHDAMKSLMKSAGFTNIHEKTLKCPIGTWPKHPVYKDAGHAMKVCLKAGIEGWVTWLFTNLGGGESPDPWSIEETQVYVAKCREELDKGYHIYQSTKRVWAQRPLEEKTSAGSAVENAPETAA